METKSFYGGSEESKTKTNNKASVTSLLSESWTTRKSAVARLLCTLLTFSLVLS